MYNYSTTRSIGTLTSSNSPTMIEPLLDAAAQTTQMTLEPMHFAGDTTSTAHGVGREYYRQGVQFYKLFTLQADLSVHERIVYSSDLYAPLVDAHTSALKELGWSTSYRPRRYEIAKPEDDDILDVEGFEATNEPQTKLPQQTPEWRQGQDANESRSTFDFRYFYDVLNHESPNDKPTIDIPTMISRLRALLTEDTEISRSSLGTL